MSKKSAANLYIGIIIVLLAVAAGFGIFRLRTIMLQESSSAQRYMCNEGKTIDALYRSDGEQNAASSTVQLRLSDGRNMRLVETASVDGVRYANESDDFVFWTKGNGALVLEDNVQKSYIGCIALAKTPAGSGLTDSFADSQAGFSIRLPETTAGKYMVDREYQYHFSKPSQGIAGVQFTVPPELARGTNLSSDSYLSVEQLPQTEVCRASLFFDDSRIQDQLLMDAGNDYSFASSIGAATGSRYEETVYALAGTNPCVAVRYFIHYGVIENYEPGTVKAFNRESLIREFDSIRRTLRIVQ
jgi:membrane-bound inhibitor of C-type lysozyme